MRYLDRQDSIYVNLVLDLKYGDIVMPEKRKRSYYTNKVAPDFRAKQRKLASSESEQGSPVDEERDTISGVDTRRTQVRTRRASLPGSITEADWAEAGHDEMFNNRRKVAFESGLAGALFKKPELFADIVNQALDNIREIVAPAIERVIKSEDSSSPSDRALFQAQIKDTDLLYAFEGWNNGKDSTTLKKLPSTREDKDFQVKFGQYIIDLLNPETNIKPNLNENLKVLYNFARFLGDPEQFDQNLKQDDINFPSESNFNSIKSEFQDQWKKLKPENPTPGLFEPPNLTSTSQRRYQRLKDKEDNRSEEKSGLFPVRTDAEKRQEAAKDRVNSNKKGTDEKLYRPFTDKTLNPSNPHAELVRDSVEPALYNITGVGLWRPGIAKYENVDTNRPYGSRNFAYEAMFRHDMPLIGGASGGIGLFMLAFKILGKIKQPELQKAFLVAASSMISKGFHSFHELATVANFLGVNYRPGDYFSVFKNKDVDIFDEIFDQNDDLKKLALTFPELIFGTELNSVIKKIKSTNEISQNEWYILQEKLSNKVKLWKNIYNKLPSDSSFRKEAQTIYALYLKEMGLNPSNLVKLLSTNAQSALQLQLEPSPSVSIKTITELITAMEKIVDKVQNLKSGESLQNIEPEMKLLVKFGQLWNHEYQKISPRNEQAREGELERINSLVDKIMGMNIQELNALVQEFSMDKLNTLQKT